MPLEYVLETWEAEPETSTAGKDLRENGVQCSS